MRKQTNRKVPQRRMCLRSLRKKAEYGRDIFGSACVRAALVLSLAAGALTLPSAAFPVMAETAADVSESVSELILSNVLLINVLHPYTLSLFLKIKKLRNIFRWDMK